MFQIRNARVLLNQFREVGIDEVICQDSPNRSGLLPNDGPLGSDPLSKVTTDNRKPITENWRVATLVLGLAKDGNFTNAPAARALALLPLAGERPL
jgi:hypothetical protein